MIDSYTDQFLAQLQDQADDQAATPIERALRTTPDNLFTEAVAVRIIEALASRILRSDWSHTDQGQLAADMLADVAADIQFLAKR